MKRRLIALLTVILTGVTALYAQNKDILVEMKTTEGTVVLRLFGDTPQHQANFVKLAREGYYDGLLFHRVIDRFMVQAGDPDSRNAAKGALLGSGSPDYTIPAEITYPRHFHKRGALAAAREGDETNPEWRSSGSQFYIVTGRRYTPRRARPPGNENHEGPERRRTERVHSGNNRRIYHKWRRGPSGCLLYRVRSGRKGLRHR